MDTQTDLIGWIHNVQAFANMLEEAAVGMKEANFDSVICRDTLDWFYQDGWDTGYGDGSSFYVPGPRSERIYGMVKGKPEEREFKDALSKVWRNLPDFYKGHPESEKVETPRDFDPEKPYPQNGIF